jgi:two-component system chemotaxis response regulator CheB
VVIRAQRTIAAGERVRVLIVDDSVTVRRLASSLIERSDGLAVAATAANGKIALRQIPECRPDVITLDVEMPEMDGLETLKAIRRDYPDIRIVMFSSATRRGATATMEALALGADDYATKGNTGQTGAGSTGGAFCDDLIPKIRQFFRFVGAGRDSGPATVAAAQPVVRARLKTEPKALVVGVSTGGPVALSALLPNIASTFPLPILIVQHMPPIFTARLAERLQTLTALKVLEASEGAAAVPGQVLIAPGDYHMRVVRKRGAVQVALDQAPPENSCRPAVDALFRSAADVWGGGVIAAVLTGMGQDGLKGVEALKAAGAFVIAQDEASSVVWGMPGAVVQAGLADVVTGLASIPSELQRLVIRNKA